MKLLLWSVSNAIVFYFAAVLSYSVQDVYAKGFTSQIALHAGLMIFAITIVWVGAMLVKQKYDATLKGAETRRILRLSAHENTDEVCVAHSRALEAIEDAN